MAKEFDNDFYRELESGVETTVDSATEVDELAFLTAKRKQLLSALESMKDNVIVDPKAIDSIIKQIAGIEREIAEKQKVRGFNANKANYDQLLSRREEIKLALEEIANAPVLDMIKKGELEQELIEIETALFEIEEIEEKDDKQREEDEKREEQQHTKQEEHQKDENDLIDTKIQEKEVRELAFKQAYYDAMIAYYAIRERNHLSTKNNSDRLVSTSEQYLEEIKAENYMYKARDAYLKLGMEDPFESARQELRKQDKRLHQDIIEKLNRKAAEYKEFEIELANLDKMRQEKEEEIGRVTDDDATQNRMQELNNDLAEIDIKRTKLKEELAIRKDKLTESIDTLSIRKARRRELNLESREYEAQSSEEKKNIRYLESGEAKRTNDYNQASKLENDSIRLEVEKNEDRFKSLQKQMKEVNEKEPDNFGKKLALLEQMHDASQQLKESREVLNDKKRGIEPDAQETAQKVDQSLMDKEKFKKAAADLIAAAKEQEQREGQEAVEDPMNDSKKVEDERRETEAIAIMGAMAIESPQGDKPIQDLIQARQIYEIAKPEGKIPPSPIPGLGQDQVKIIDNTPEGIKNAEETIKMAEEAQKDARDVQRDIEETVQV